jgi:hypothetical protein
MRVWTTNSRGFCGSLYFSFQDGNQLRRPLDSSGNSTIDSQSGAESGALGAGDLPDDAELNAVIDAWPNLPPAIKAGVLAMIRATAPAENRKS